MEDCIHYNIVLVTEIPKDNKGNFGVNKTFVECEDCQTILNIGRITKVERIVPLYNAT